MQDIRTQIRLGFGTIRVATKYRSKNTKPLLEYLNEVLQEILLTITNMEDSDTSTKVMFLTYNRITTLLKDPDNNWAEIEAICDMIETALKYEE